MGSFINITSNNFSGETAEVYFLPCSGGALENYGSQTLPIDLVNISEDNTSTYGLYQVYLTDFNNQLCEVEYNCPGPGYAFFSGDNNTGYVDPTDMCINAIFDEPIYSAVGSVSVGNALYLDSALTSPYTFGSGAGVYSSLKYAFGENVITYAVKTDDNGVITEIINCATLTGATPTPTPTTAPEATSTPTPTPTGLSYRIIQLSNTQSTSNDACGLSSGTNKYVDNTWTITNGLSIYDDSSLTTKTYTSDPGGYSLVIDNGIKYAVNFDNSGNVDTVVDC